jgi:hypothetical protein
MLEPSNISHFISFNIMSLVIILLLNNRSKSYWVVSLDSISLATYNVNFNKVLKWAP